MLEKDLLKHFDKKDICISCENCEFNFPHNDSFVCAGNNEYYGKSIGECKKSFPNGCNCWKMSYEMFCEVNEHLKKR